MATVLQGSYLEIKKQMDKLDPLAHPLLQWYGWSGSGCMGSGEGRRCGAWICTFFYRYFSILYSL